MPGIGAMNPMGGMPAMNRMYQTLAADRRQNGQIAKTEDGTAKPEQSELAATQTQTGALPQASAPTQQTGGLPGVEALDNAAGTLAQMRVRFSDPADAAFEQYKAAESAQSAMTPAPPPAPDGNTDAMGRPPEENAAAMQGERPLPPEGEEPEAATQAERLPFATAAAGIV